MADATDDAGLALFKSMRFIYFPNHSRPDEVTQGSIAFQPPRAAWRQEMPPSWAGHLGVAPDLRP